MGVCTICGSLTTLLLDTTEGANCPTDDPLRIFLIGDDELPAVSPAWIRLHRLTSESPWDKNWRFIPGSCSTCNTRTVCRLIDRRQDGITEFTLCFGCGLVVLIEKGREGKPDRPPVEGIIWNPPCFVVKRLRRAAFRRFEIPPWLRPSGRFGGWHS